MIEERARARSVDCRSNHSLQLVRCYDLQAEFAESVDEYYHRVVAEGLVEPLADEPVGTGGA